MNPSLRCLNFPKVLNPDKGVKTKLGRTLDYVLEKKTSAKVYLDNMTIESEKIEEPLEQIRLFEAFENNNFKLELTRICLSVKNTDPVESVFPLDTKNRDPVKNCHYQRINIETSATLTRFIQNLRMI